MARFCKFSVIAAATCVVALLSSGFTPVAAQLQTDPESMDTLRAVDDRSHGGAASSDRQREFRYIEHGLKSADISGADVAGASSIVIQTMETGLGHPGYLAASDELSDDRRDSSSVYACTTVHRGFAASFVGVDAPEEGGFLLKLVHNGMQGLRNEDLAVNWFLSVHSAGFADNKYDFFTRVILHSDESKAAVWRVVADGGNYVLELVHNRSPGTSNAYKHYLAIPVEAWRDDTSKYVAVSSDDSDAVPVHILLG